jgi:hypothetical protein
MVEAGILFEKFSLGHELVWMPVSKKRLVQKLVALLIWVLILIKLSLGLFFGLFGFRLFSLARRVKQKMRREPFSELPQGLLRIVFIDFDFGSSASSASFFRIGHIIFGENWVLGVQRA